MGKRKVPVIKMYHVRYVADVLVPASATKEAFFKADEFIIDRLDDDTLDIDDTFTVTMESEHFHIVSEAYFDEDDETDDASIENEDDYSDGEEDEEDEDIEDENEDESDEDEE
jgi:hypothetical protein